MKIHFMIAILVLLSVPVFGQIALEWEMIPQSEGDNLDVPYDQTKVTANDYRISLGLPVVLSKTDTGQTGTPSLVLINGAFYSNKHLQVDKWPEYSYNAAQQYQLNLYDTYDHMVSFGYTATLMKTLSSKWSMLAIGGFTYASMSAKEFESSDLGFVGGLAGIRSWESGWSFGFGLYYGRLTGIEQLLPVIILERKTAKSALNISLPSGMSYWYHMNKQLSLGLLSEMQGDLYAENRLTANEYDENGQLVSTDNKVAMAYSSVTLGPALKYSMQNHVSIVLRTGLAMVRRYQYWLPEKAKILRYSASPDYQTLTGHDYSGEEVEFPIKDNVFIKLTIGFGL